jgi:hypothetical protein
VRFLRNPIVSGILAVVAVLVVAYQFAGSNLHFRLGGTAGQVVNAIAPALVAPSPPTEPPATNQVAEVAGPGPEVAIDRAYLEARFAKWVASPLRDPFLLFSTDPKDKKDDEEFASPISKWHLNGIWDQTGGKLAVINKRVHRIGDEIEGYKILKIEGEEVWFQGPKRKERLALEKKGPSVLHNPVFMPATNDVPASTVPQ